MGFSLTNIFGKKNAKTQAEDTVEAIINDIETQPFGISNSNVLFAGLNELGGYYFFQTVIVGDFKIKTFKGIHLQLKGETGVMTLKSDTDELESELTSVKGRYVTTVDFEVSDSNLETLKQEKITEITVTEKSKNVVFTKYNNSDEEE